MLKNKQIISKLLLGLCAVFMLVVISPNAWAEEECKHKKNLDYSSCIANDKNPEGCADKKFDDDKKIKSLAEDIKKLKCQNDENDKNDKKCCDKNANEATKMECDRKTREKQGEIDRREAELRSKCVEDRTTAKKNCEKKLYDDADKKCKREKEGVSGDNGDLTKDQKEILKQKEKDAKSAFEECKKNNKCKNDADIQSKCKDELKNYRQLQYDICIIEKGSKDKCKKEYNQLNRVGQADSNAALEQCVALYQEAVNLAVSGTTSGDCGPADTKKAEAEKQCQAVNRDILGEDGSKKIEENKKKYDDAYEKCKKTAGEKYNKINDAAIAAACKKDPQPKTVTVVELDSEGKAQRKDIELDCSNIKNNANSNVQTYLDGKTKLDNLVSECSDSAKRDTSTVEFQGTKYGCNEIAKLKEAVEKAAGAQDKAREEATQLLAAQNALASDIERTQKELEACNAGLADGSETDSQKCQNLADELDRLKKEKADLDQYADTYADYMDDATAEGNANGSVKSVSEDAYSASSVPSIFSKIARRAAFVLVSLKKLIYILAGFGLIGFAWMAIFGKISWKWFGNIVISLFLVANMGRFIEYFVYKDADGAQSVTQKTFGDYMLHDILQDSNVDFDPSAAKAKGYDKNGLAEQEGIDLEGIDGSTNSTAKGFCSGNNGTGWSNFMNCAKDVVSSVKKGVDAAKTAANTVTSAINTTKNIVNTAKNIGNAFKNADSFGDVMNAIGTAANGASSIMSQTTNMASNIAGNIGNIANDIQDIGKSVDEQKELEEQRRNGESTNGVAGAMGKVGDVIDSANELGGVLGDGLGAVGSAANAVGSLANTIDSTFGISEGKREKEQEKARQEQEQIQKENKAESDLKQKEDALAKAEKEKEEACKDPNSSACQLAELKLDAAKQAKEEAEKFANETYEKKRQEEIDAAQKAKKEAEKNREKACKDESSMECLNAKIAEKEAEIRLAEANEAPSSREEKVKQENQAKEEEQAKRDGEKKTQEQKRKEQQAENEIRQKEQALEKAEADEKRKCKDPNSTACAAARQETEALRAEKAEAEKNANENYKNQRQQNIDDAQKKKNEAEKARKNACADGEDTAACKRAKAEEAKAQLELEEANNAPKTREEKQEQDRQKNNNEADDEDEYNYSPSAARPNGGTVTQGPQLTGGANGVPAAAARPNGGTVTQSPQSTGETRGAPAAAARPNGGTVTQSPQSTGETRGAPAAGRTSGRASFSTAPAAIEGSVSASVGRNETVAARAARLTAAAERPGASAETRAAAQAARAQVNAALSNAIAPGGAEAYEQQRRNQIARVNQLQAQHEEVYAASTAKVNSLSQTMTAAQKTAEADAAKARAMMQEAIKNKNVNQYNYARKLEDEAKNSAKKATEVRQAYEAALSEQKTAEAKIADIKAQAVEAANIPTYEALKYTQANSQAVLLEETAAKAKKAYEQATARLKVNNSLWAQKDLAKKRAAYEAALAQAAAAREAAEAENPDKAE